MCMNVELIPSLYWLGGPDFTSTCGMIRALGLIPVLGQYVQCCTHTGSKHSMSQTYLWVDSFLCFKGIKLQNVLEGVICSDKKISED